MSPAILHTARCRPPDIAERPGYPQFRDRRDVPKGFVTRRACRDRTGTPCMGATGTPGRYTSISTDRAGKEDTDASVQDAQMVPPCFPEPARRELDRPADAVPARGAQCD